MYNWCCVHFFHIITWLYLHSRGHQNVGYIDDSLLVTASFLSCWHNVQDTVFLMDSLGFTIHPDKSVLIPTISFVVLF